MMGLLSWKWDCHEQSINFLWIINWGCWSPQTKLWNHQKICYSHKLVTDMKGIRLKTINNTTTEFCGKYVFKMKLVVISFWWTADVQYLFDYKLVWYKICRRAFFYFRLDYIKQKFWIIWIPNVDISLSQKSMKKIHSHFSVQKLHTSVYRKSTINGVATNFEI